MQRHRQRRVIGVSAAVNDLDVWQQQVDPAQGQQVGQPRKYEQWIITEARSQNEAGDLDNGHAADIAAEGREAGHPPDLRAVRHVGDQGEEIGGKPLVSRQHDPQDRHRRPCVRRGHGPRQDQDQ